MRTLSLLLGVVFLSSVAVSAQALNPAKIKFRGLGLDSTYQQVVRTLGKPESETEPAREECIGAHEKTVKYPGLEMFMMDGDSKDGKTFEIKSFEITTAAYSVSGIKVGDSEAVVKKRLGKRFRPEPGVEAGERVYFYRMNDTEGPGTTRFAFKNGKLVLIASDYLVC